MTTLGPFSLGEEIGSGGMAVVFEARHIPTDAPVAVKVMTSRRSREARYRRAFLREVRSAVRLDHPRIARVLDVGEIPPALQKENHDALKAGAPYIVMELVRGGSLDDHADRLDWPVIRNLTMELLDALSHAHALGVIHRDIKPANVLIDSASGFWTPKLTDFGIARTVDSEHPDPSDRERRVSGTPKYMAPERVMGKWRDQGPWTDLYSLGVMVWGLVTGKNPYGGTTKQVMFAQIQDPLPPFEPIMEVPERLEPWLHGMLAKSPHERFRRAADAAVAFAEVCGSPTHRTWVSGLEETIDHEIRSSDENPEALPTLTMLLESQPPPEVHRRHGRHLQWPRPVLPADWRRDLSRTRAYRRLSGAGLGLFSLRTIPVIGRRDERDTLWNALVEVDDTGRLGVVVVRGPAGTGKTRLVEWLTQRADEVGAARPLTAVHSESGGPTEGFAGALEQFFRTRGLDEADATTRIGDELRRVTRGDDAFADYDADTFVQIMNASSDARRSVEFFTPAERWHALRRWLGRIALARTPILWIEDAHLAIDAVRFVRFLHDDAPPDFPLLVILSLRTEGPFVADSVRDDLEALEENATVVPLGRMTDSNLRMMVRGTLAPALADEVARRADGMPAVAVQIVNEWVEAGALSPGEGGFVLADSDALEVPDDVHQLWLRRLHRVVDDFEPSDRPAFDALLIAALLGRYVDLEEWTRCYRELTGVRSAADFLGALADRLVTLGLADRVRDGWTFAHGMMRESLQRSARAERSEELHRACAKGLADRHTELPPSTSRRVALHLHECGDDVAALDVLLAAIRLAKRAHDYDWIERLLAAADPITTALGLDDADPRRGQLEIARVRILTARNKLSAAGTLTEKIAADATRHGWDHTHAEATFQLATNALNIGRADRAIELFEDARTLFDRLDEPHNLARACESIGYAYLHLGKWREAKPYVLRAGELYEEFEEHHGTAYNLYHRGIIARYEGDIALSRKCYEESARIASRLGFRDTLANALNALGDLDRYAGDLEIANDHYRDAFDLWSAIGASGANIAAINLAITLLQQSRWDEAEDLLEPLVDELQRENAGMQLTFALAGLLPIYAARGDTARFDRTLEHFDARLATYELHDPDLTLMRDMTADLWQEAGDDTRRSATLKTFGD